MFNFEYNIIINLFYFINRHIIFVWYSSYNNYIHCRYLMILLYTFIDTKLQKTGYDYFVPKFLLSVSFGRCQNGQYCLK